MIFELTQGSSVTGFSSQNDDYVFYMTDGGSITLKDVNTYTTVPKIKFRTVNSKGKYTDYIRYINGKAFNDYTTKSYDNDNNTLINGTFKKDYIGIASSFEDTIVANAKDGDDFIQNYHSITAATINPKKCGKIKIWKE